MDVPWKLNLNNKNTVKKLVTNSNNLRECCLAGTRYKTLFDFDNADVLLKVKQQPDLFETLTVQ
jgi:hypothetical protein